MNHVFAIPPPADLGPLPGMIGSRELEQRALLSSVAANPVVVSEVEGQSTIGLTILNLPGAIQDTSGKPSYTFSNAQVVNAGDGTVNFSNTRDGTFTYTPPSSTFTGNVTIFYDVSDGTGTSGSTVEIDVGPISADPVTWGTLSSTTATIPSTTVPSLLNRIQDASTKPSYIFSNPVVPVGDGAISDLRRGDRLLHVHRTESRRSPVWSPCNTR